MATALRLLAPTGSAAQGREPGLMTSWQASLDSSISHLQPAAQEDGTRLAQMRDAVTASREDYARHAEEHKVRGGAPAFAASAAAAERGIAPPLDGREASASRLRGGRAAPSSHAWPQWTT